MDGYSDECIHQFLGVRKSDSGFSRVGELDKHWDDASVPVIRSSWFSLEGGKPTWWNFLAWFSCQKILLAVFSWSSWCDSHDSPGMMLWLILIRVFCLHYLYMWIDEVGRWPENRSLFSAIFWVQQAVFLRPEMGWRTIFLKITQNLVQKIWQSRARARVEVGNAAANNWEKSPPAMGLFLLVTSWRVG